MKQDHEIKSEMITKMGDEFGSLFYPLYEETVWLIIKWDDGIYQFKRVKNRKLYYP